MKNRRGTLMKIIDTSGWIKSYLLTLFPIERYRIILQNTPKTSFITIFLDNGKFRGFDCSAQKHDYIGVSESFHGMTFREKIFKSILRIMIVHFELFYCYNCFSPFCLEDNTVTSLRYLLHIPNFIIIYF